LKMDAEKLTLIQIVLRGEDGVTFYEKGSSSEKGYWYLTGKEEGRIDEAGPQNKNGDIVDYKTQSFSAFLEWAKNKELVAETTIYREERGYDQETFEEWDHLTRYLHIADLVVLSTKVPKAVAGKFRYYASRTSDTSSVLREIVYGYVKEQIVENAERDMFKD